MSSSIYQVDLSFYKEMRIECEIAHPSELKTIAREMIYYNHWTNSVMFEFLHSHTDISTVIENLEMRTVDEFMDIGLLF
jgi:hypothetical protein